MGQRVRVATGAKAVAIPSPPETPFRLVFGFKASAEVEVEGKVGLILEGYASKFNKRDADQEYQVPGSFDDIVDTWGRQGRPMVLFEHGRDPLLMRAPIGWGLSWKTDDVGLYVKCFLPRDPSPPFSHQAEAKTARYAEVYNGVKSSVFRHFSVGGLYRSLGKALLRWSTDEITVCRRGCLGEDAAFFLGTKAVADMEDAADGGVDEGLEEQGTVGLLSRPAWGRVMKVAQKHKDHMLHDHLLSRHSSLQGDHNPEDCPVCADTRASMGIKAEDWLFDKGAKAPKKDGPDSDYLVVDEEGQHLRVKVNGTPDHGLMGGAYAALTSNHRGQPYQGGDKEGALSRLRALYKAEKMDWPGDKKGDKSAEDEAKDEAKDEAIAEGVVFLEDFLAGEKIAKRHSAATVDRIRSVIAELESLIGESDQDDKTGS